MPSNIKPPWIEDAPKALKILEKKRVLGPEEWPKGLKIVMDQVRRKIDLLKSNIVTRKISHKDIFSSDFKCINLFTFKSCQVVRSVRFSTTNLWSDLGPGALPRVQRPPSLLRPSRSWNLPWPLPRWSRSRSLGSGRSRACWTRTLLDIKKMLFTDSIQTIIVRMPKIRNLHVNYVESTRFAGIPRCANAHNCLGAGRSVPVSPLCWTLKQL